MRPYVISTKHGPYDLERGRLVELERPAAYHGVTVFPSHTFRCEVTLDFHCLAHTQESARAISHQLKKT